jgi:outer membrane biosynthesis protein TonB
MSGVTARIGRGRPRPEHSAAMWLAAALLAVFATAFVISLGLSRDDRTVGAPASSALGPAPPVAVPLRPARLHTVAPMPDLRRTAKRPTPVPAPPAPARPVATTAPTVTPTPTPTQEAIPEAPAPTPAPAPAPTARPAPRPERAAPPSHGQEFDSSG